MSLINDALKRAKQQSQANAAPADVPAMRPDFAPSRSRARNDFLLPALVVIVLLMAVLLLWQWFRSGHGEVTVRARVIPTGESAKVAPIPTPAVAPVVAPTFAVVPAVVVSNTPVATNALQAVAVPATPPPPTYKLQSIFYRAKNPSIAINGKLLMIGDHIGEARVTAITKQSATLMTAKGETKVLELPE